MLTATPVTAYGHIPYPSSISRFFSKATCLIKLASTCPCIVDKLAGSTRPLLLHYTYNTAAEQNTFTIAFVEADPVVPHASIEPGPVVTYNDVIRSASGAEVFVHTYNTTWNCLNDLTTCKS